MEFEKHYARKEHYLFPFLEKYQFTGSFLGRNWGIQDDIRKGWKGVWGDPKSPGAPELLLWQLTLKRPFSLWKTPFVRCST